VRISAAVLADPGRPLEVAEVELAAPRQDEVLVRLHASGICRSDLSLQEGKWPVPLPIVLGHEGAGVVERVGDNVPSSRVGEHVVLTFAPACGRCRFCLAGRVNLCSTAAAGYESGTMLDGTTRLSLDDRPVHHLAFVSSFATHAVVPAAGALPIPQELDLSLACLLGCGITTGIMSVSIGPTCVPGNQSPCSDVAAWALPPSKERGL
jgi:S-(hydroxymethyl)glutathione dehydrogenase / alcohol dehydrogenase